MRPLAPGLRAAPVGTCACALLFLVFAASACTQRPAASVAREAGTDSPATASEPVKENATRPRVVALGDSLTAGYGLQSNESYPAVLQQRIDREGLGYEVVNMGVSGDTSAGGLRRLDWALDGDVRVLVVALGANDGLRGLPVGQLASNLGAIVDRATSRHIAVLLCGMEAPPNYGTAYTRAFRDVYARLAREKQVAFIPFMLQGVAGVPQLNQADGIHPTAEGARRVADLIWTQLAPMLQEHATTR